MCRSLGFMVCLVVTGCSERTGGDLASRAADALDVYETVFRYQLKNSPADARAYLSVDGQDPSPDLLTRLLRDWPNLKPISEEPKEKGRHVSVKGLKWINRDAAELRAGYWFPTKFAGEGHFADYHVVRQGKQWVVQKVANEIMS